MLAQVHGLLTYLFELNQLLHEATCNYSAFLKTDTLHLYNINGQEILPYTAGMMNSECINVFAVDIGLLSSMNTHYN